MAAKTLQNHTKAAAAASAASSGIFLLWQKLSWKKKNAILKSDFFPISYEKYLALLRYPSAMFVYRRDTIKLRVLTRLISKHMQAFSNYL